jgi:bile acid-coenzyme A ligase
VVVNEETDSTQTQPVSWGRRLSMLADEHPDKPAIIFSPQQGEDQPLSWRELDLWSNRLARRFMELELGEQSMLVIGLPNCLEHYVAAYAGWKVGALVLPVRANLPPIERDGILEVGNPTVVVGDWDGITYQQVTTQELHALDDYSDALLPDKVAHPGKSVGSGGSTGRSKIIVDPRRWEAIPGSEGRGNYSGFNSGQVQLIAGALYHNSPFSWGHFGLFEDHTLILMERFDAVRAVDLIERYKVNFAFLAPTMMKRIVDLPGVTLRDFSSIEGIFQTAAPCPIWLKRAFMELVPPERLHESFGSSEAVGVCSIRGDEWLEHPGSVGRPRNSDLQILDEEFNALPTGEVGEIFMRPHDTGEPTYYYIGSPPAKSTPDGFVSVGDMGYVDHDGYVYLADRRVDLIISGGANIYPAEVEAPLSQHPDVVDVVVIGIPDDDWGKRVHAIVHPRDIDNPPTVSALDAWAREHLASYKVPKTYEFLPELPRDGAGKIRRTTLVAERSATERVS